MNKATVAVAHSILVAAWHMLSTGENYQDLGADYFSHRRSPEAETAPAHRSTPSPRTRSYYHARGIELSVSPPLRGNTTPARADTGRE